ncbi:MAG: hypothetical protein COT14_03525 [Candidatus Diapherotrites archaeon CG08_land_8_20_14_0_20_30_16]|nr:MAG: hypothetical protein COT14_03525 [Candidatus Diapherotrites archaeon CG08_land_8_20_14_0_20_30_16]
MENKEKKVTIGINVKGTNFNHKAKHAMTVLRAELKKHFRNKECVISMQINEFVWSKGRVNNPSKISLVGVEKNNKTYLFLDTPEDLKRKDELLSGKKGDVKDETKTSSKKTEKDKEHKKEDSKENKKEDTSKKEVTKDKSQETKSEIKKPEIKKEDIKTRKKEVKK